MWCFTTIHPTKIISHNWFPNFSSAKTKQAILLTVLLPVFNTVHIYSQSLHSLFLLRLNSVFLITTQFTTNIHYTIVWMLSLLLFLYFWAGASYVLFSPRYCLILLLFLWFCWEARLRFNNISIPTIFYTVRSSVILATVNILKFDNKMKVYHILGSACVRSMSDQSNQRAVFLDIQNTAV